MIQMIKVTLRRQIRFKHLIRIIQKKQTSKNKVFSANRIYITNNPLFIRKKTILWLTSKPKITNHSNHQESVKQLQTKKWEFK